MYIIVRVHMHAHSERDNAMMIEYLYRPHPATDNMVCQILVGYGQAITQQLIRNSSTYLPDGELHNLVNKCRRGDGTESEIKKLKEIFAAPTTSDTMESFFAVLDNFLKTNSKNCKLSTGSAVAAWRYNVCYVHISPVVS